MPITMLGVLAATAMAISPSPQAANPNHVAVKAVASAVRVDGRVVRTSDWNTYDGNRGKTRRCPALPPELVFDALGVEARGCNGGGGYSFGPDYWASAVAEDMSFDTGWSGSVLTQVSFAWSYHPVELAIDQDFCIALFFYNETIGHSCGPKAFPDDFTPCSDGMIANFGQLPAGEWFTSVKDLNDLGVLFPDEGSGTYEQLFLLVDNISGDISICPRAVGPLLWGTGDDDGTPTRPGTNDFQIFLDDGGTAGRDPDIVFQTDECYDMRIKGVCPSPLANAIAFYSAVMVECYEKRIDMDCDGFLTGMDFDLFVHAFEAGDSDADYDGDGFISGIDYDLWVQDFECGCFNC